MENKKRLSDCSICDNNDRNHCMSQNGYYVYREVIIDEKVPCDDWNESQNSFAYKLETKKKFKAASKE